MALMRGGYEIGQRRGVGIEQKNIKKEERS